MQRVIGYVMISIAITCWGMTGVFGRFGLAEGVTPLEIAFWRAVIGGFFFAAQGACTGLWRASAKQRLVFGAFGLPGIALLFLTYQVGVQYSGAALTSVLNNTAPIWVGLWSYLFFKESLSVIKMVSIVIAIMGAALVSFSGGGLGGDISIIGVAAALASGVCYSLHYPFGKIFLRNVSPVTLYMHILPVGALFLLPFVDFAPKSGTVWLSLLGLGFLSSWIAFRVFCEALKRLESSNVAIMAPLEPFIAAFFAYMFWDEQFSVLGWVGAVLVVGAVILSGKKSKREKEAQCSEEAPA